VATALATTGASVNVSNAAPPVAGQYYLTDSPISGSYQFPFAMRADWANVVNDYSGSGVQTQTTTASPTSAGSTTVYLTSASSFKASQGISIAGAGTAGADHTTTIASVNTASNYVVLNVATVTTVSSGAIVYHDDTVSINNALGDTGSVGVYLPHGDFIISTSAYSSNAGSAILYMAKMGKKFCGSRTGSVFSGHFGYGVPGVSRILRRNASANALHMGSVCCDVFDLYFTDYAGITPTAGSAIVVGKKTSGGVVFETNNSNKTAYQRLYNIEVEGLYDAITIYQSDGGWIDHIQTYLQKRYGIQVDCPVPYGGWCMDKLQFNSIGGASDTGAGAAVFVKNADWMNYGVIKSTACKYGFYEDLNSGNHGQQMIDKLIVDSLSANGYGYYVSGAVAQPYPNIVTAARINAYLGTGAWYMGANSAKNIIKTGFTCNGGTNTNTGTGNDVSGVLIA
jgi:hypothetical protein